MNETPSARPAPVDYAGYILMPPASTYALGAEALRSALETEATAHLCVIESEIYRPLTCKENIKAMVENYEMTHTTDGSKRSIEERLFLITKQWKDSCTGMVYQKGTTKFKVVSQAHDLITLPSDFREPFKSIDYERSEGVELDSSKDTYNTNLTLARTVEHPGWRAAVEEDTHLLTAYANIVFAELERIYHRSTGMGFYVCQNTPTDELRALFVKALGSHSSASGDYVLNDGGSFLLVARRVRL